MIDFIAVMQHMGQDVPTFCKSVLQGFTNTCRHSHIYRVDVTQHIFRVAVFVGHKDMSCG